MNFADALRQKIARSFKSYDENGKDIGVAGTTMYRWASGEEKPTPERRRQLYDQFDLHEYGVDRDE